MLIDCFECSTRVLVLLSLRLAPEGLNTFYSVVVASS
jgi:hypothetical protein